MSVVDLPLDKRGVGHPDDLERLEFAVPIQVVLTRLDGMTTCDVCFVWGDDRRQVLYIVVRFGIFAEK